MYEADKRAPLIRLKINQFEIRKSNTHTQAHCLTHTRRNSVQGQRERGVHKQTTTKATATSKGSLGLLLTTPREAIFRLFTHTDTQTLTRRSKRRRRRQRQLEC